jgi:hypothetical protein
MHKFPKPAKGTLPRSSTALLTLVLATAVAVPVFTGSEPLIQTAQAQDVSLTVQFRGALEPHGRWSRHNRWGEIWIPAKRDRDWRPYTVGRWTYTDRWGWYWVSDEDFGWVTYHYGRWVLTPEFGWAWIPGTTWGPAWVQWRRGDRHAGWAPLPPQEVIYEYDDSPDYWVFVSMNNFIAPNIVRVIVPPRERVVYLRETVIINRTIIVDRGDRDRRGYFAVNPGIEPRIIAARVGKPIRVSSVKPVVVVGTVGVDSAVEIRGDEVSKRRGRIRAEISESKETVQPVKDVPPPEALKKGEEGRLGDRPPEAAKGGKPVPATQVQDRVPDADAAKGKPDATKGGAPDATKGGTDAAKGAPDATKGGTDAAKGAPDATKGATDAAKGTAKGADDAAKGKLDATKGTTDAAKSKTDDAAKSKLDDAAAKAKSKADDGAAKARSKAEDDAAKSKTKADDGAAKARSKADDDAKSKAEDSARGARSKAPEPKGEKSTPEPKQAAPKSAPEPKQESRPEPKQSAPRQAPEPKQESRPQPEPKQAPQPKQAEPKSAPEPRQAAPKSAPEPKASRPEPKGGSEKEKGKDD